VSASEAPALQEARRQVGRELVPSKTVRIDSWLVDAFELATGAPLTAGATDTASRKVPPTLVYHLVRREFDITSDQRPAPLIDLPLGSPVNGGIEFTFVRPLIIGETVRVETSLDSVDHRDTRRSGLTIVVVKTTVSDAGNREVASYRHTTLYRASS
jgi:hypothetical protein